MLQDYVKLGQCEGCPFETTGMSFGYLPYLLQSPLAALTLSKASR